VFYELFCNITQNAILKQAHKTGM